MTEDDVREEIMSATYEALCEHGYTELTAQNIADRTDKSKSLLFYHYDSKEDLIADFFDWLLDSFEERVEETRDLDPVDRLSTFVDWFLYDPEDDRQASFHTAVLELRAQAPFNDAYRDQLRRSDDLLRATLTEILEEGIDGGQFEPHDTSETTSLLIAAFDGARIRQLTLDRDAYLVDVRSAAIERVFEGLLVDGVEFPAEPDAAGREGGTSAEDESAGASEDEDAAE